MNRKLNHNSYRKGFSITGHRLHHGKNNKMINILTFFSLTFVHNILTNLTMFMGILTNPTSKSSKHCVNY